MPTTRPDRFVSTRAGSRGSPRFLGDSGFQAANLGFQLARAPEGARDPPEGRRSLCRGCFNSRGLPREPAIAAPAKPSPTHLVSTRAGSRGSPRYDGVDRVSRIDWFQLARAPEGARDSSGVLDVRAPQGFNSRGLPREPAISRSLRCVDSLGVSTRAGSRGSPRFFDDPLHVPPPMRFNSRGLPREPAIFFPRIDQEDQGGFNSRGLPREPAMLAQQHLAPGVYVSTRAGSRGSPRWTVDHSGPLSFGVSTRAGSRGSPRFWAHPLLDSVFEVSTRAGSRGSPRFVRLAQILACDAVSTRAGSRGSPRSVFYP